MGPTNESGEVKVSVLARIKHDVKKAIQVYFDKPLHYIFYSSLALLLIALLLGVNVSWQFYLILIILAYFQPEIKGAIKLPKRKSKKF